MIDKVHKKSKTKKNHSNPSMSMYLLLCVITSPKDSFTASSVLGICNTNEAI